MVEKKPQTNSEKILNGKVTRRPNSEILKEFWEEKPNKSINPNFVFSSSGLRFFGTWELNSHSHNHTHGFNFASG